MRHPDPGMRNRAPYRLPIASSGVVCAMTGRLQPMLRCSACPHFQGMLVGPAPCVLCAVPIRFPRRRTRTRRSTLIFDRDWPDD